MDSGAGGNFISTHFAEKNGLNCVPSEHCPVTFANGSAAASTGQIRNALVKIGRYRDKISLRTLPLSNYDVILGSPWLAKLNPAINWQTRTLHFSFKNETITLAPGKSTFTSNPVLLSAMQLQKHCRRGAPLGVAFVRQVQTENSGTSLHPDRMQQLLVEFADIFPDKLPPGLPPKRTVDHEIVEEHGSKPTKRPYYRMSPQELAELKRQLQELLDNGHIRPSDSPYAAPVLFVTKKDGLRMCVNWRALNRQTVKNRYPLPLATELMDQLGGAKIFSKLDLQSGYNQVRMNPESIPKTAFTCRYGHFEFMVMGFGLTNAPATFMSLMNDVFKDILDSHVVVFLDDICVYSRTPDEHERHLRAVLSRLREHKLYAKASKCSFFQEEVEFLGFTVGNNGISVTESKISAVRDWPTPRDLKELRQFLGLVSYLRRHIKDFSPMRTP